MAKLIKNAALALVASGILAASASPALADPRDGYGDYRGDYRGEDRNERWEHSDRGRHGGWGRGGNYRGGQYGGYNGGGYYGSNYRYDEPVYRDTRVWRGNDGRTYCRRGDGTTGLLIGGLLGGVLGNEVAGRRGDRTLGAILGAGAGALLGREVDRGGSRCR